MFEKYAYRDMPADKLALENNLWEELKVDSSSFSGTIYIICAVIALLIIAFFVYRYVIKRKRRKLYWNKQK